MTNKHLQDFFRFDGYENRPKNKGHRRNFGKIIEI